MSHEQEFDRTHSNAKLARKLDDHEAGPGRISRSSLLDAPSHPIAGGLIQRKARDDNGVEDGADHAVASASSSSGSALPDTLMRKFESSLGADLSSVRVHTGAESATAASAVGAKAYTMGQDIHFGAGQYDPSSGGGEHLLAHEVAHTVQQQNGGTQRRQYKLEVSSPHDAAEHEADRAADAMVSGSSFGIGGSAGGIHRETNPNVKPAETPDLVGSHWKVDWVNKQTGADVNSTSTARTGNDAAYGKANIEPETDAGKSVLIDWVNAASSGAVEIGSMPHAKDKGGKVSTSIRYGTPPTVKSAAINLELSGETEPGKKPPAAEMAKKQALASTAVVDRLHSELGKEGNDDTLKRTLEAAAHEALGAPPAGYTYDVRITLAEHLDGRGGNPKSPAAVAYNKFSAPGTRKLTITTPADFEKIKGNQAFQSEINKIDESNKANKASKDHVDTKETKNTTDVETYYINQLTIGINGAWSNLKQKASHDNNHVEGSFKGNLASHDKADGTLKDLPIDFGTLFGLLAIENPAVAFALKKAFGKGVIGGDLLIEFAGDLTAGAAATKDWGSSDYNRELTKLDGGFKKFVETQVKTQVKTLVQTLVRNDSHSEHTDDAKKVDAKRVVVASSGDTVAVKHVNHDPILTVTDE